jgi:hypothetical protein
MIINRSNLKKNNNKTKRNRMLLKKKKHKAEFQDNSILKDKIEFFLKKTPRINLS